MLFIVNWLGLTIGLTAVIVMYIYVKGELNHDSCYERPMDNVYRLDMNDEMQAIVPIPLAKFIVSVPEIESATNISTRQMTIGTDEESQNRKNFKMDVLLADSSFYDVLPLKMVSTDVRNLIPDGNKALVSRSTAQKLYGTSDVVGKSLLMNNNKRLEISGVFEDQGENSHLSGDVITNFKAMWGEGYDPTNNWSHWSTSLYLRVNPSSDMAALETKVCKAVRDRISNAYGGGSGYQYADSSYMRPFNSLYFRTVDSWSTGKSVDINNVRIPAIIAIIILIVAVINYVNIYTARSTEVIRSMGIKSIMGASRRGLVFYIIADSVIVVFISVVTAFLSARILEPLYPEIIGVPVVFNMDWITIMTIFVGLPLFCGVLCGILPAWTMTRMKPLDAMGNRSSGGLQMASVRNGLMAFQFAVSIALISSTIIINKQMKYMNSLDVGYNRENIVEVNGEGFMSSSFDQFRTALLRNPNIINAAKMSTSPIYLRSISTYDLNPTTGEYIDPFLLYGDENSFDVFGLQMLEGDSITVANKDSLGGKVIVNEAFAKMLKEKNPDAIFPGGDYIGLFKNFRHRALSEEMVSPMVFGGLGRDNWGNAYIKIGGHDVDGTMRYISDTFRELWPDELYGANFIDTSYAALYESEQLFRSQLTTFSLLAILIGCLGLYALVAYSVERRRKEIALRKINGATITSVMVMLSIAFLKWLAISFVIAVPVVVIVMNKWLQGYLFRTNLSWWIFAVAGVLTLIIALITVLGRSYSAATENPAEAVKSE